jgi:hypothetical protein
MNLINELESWKNQLKEDYTLSDFEALQIAAKLQQNRILSDVYMLNETIPVLEKTAILLGAREENKDSKTKSVIESLSDIAEILQNFYDIKEKEHFN